MTPEKVNHVLYLHYPSARTCMTHEDVIEEDVPLTECLIFHHVIFNHWIYRDGKFYGIVSDFFRAHLN